MAIIRRSPSNQNTMSPIHGNVLPRLGVENTGR
jgi:hypothetical protein